MLAIGRYLLVVLGLLACGAGSPRAEDFERGKSGPAIFAADCSGCHRNAQGLAYGMSPSDLMSLLQQHYTTGPGPANQVAAYLLSVKGNGRRPKEKPLTEPRTTAEDAGEPASKRRPRGEEEAPAGQRPPAEIGSHETPVGQESGGVNARGGPEPASKRRQQAAHPAEPALPSRSKKPGQPATATRGTPSEPARPPGPIPAQPSESVAARPVEPAAAPEPQPPGEAKPPVTAPRQETAKPEAVKPEAAAEAGPVHAAVPAERPKPAARRETEDQPAFSAPSP